MSATRVVSVCIPSYNHARFLRPALDSVLAQTHDELEVVVFDDGSTDGSLELAREYASKDERVRVLTHADGRNRGVGPTVKAATDAATGVYIAGLAADDVYLPHALGRMVEALEANPGAGLVYGRTELIDVDGNARGLDGGIAPEEICTFDRTSDPYVSLLLHDFIPAPTVLVRRDLFQAVGGYDERIYYSDWELWIRILARHRLVYVPETLVRFRLHGIALTEEAGVKDLERKLDFYRLLAEKSESIGGALNRPRLRALVALQWALSAARLGCHDEAHDALVRAFEFDAEIAGDVEFLFWWLAPLRRYNWPGGVSDGAASVGAAGNAAFGLLGMLRELLAPATVDAVAWELLANEIEAQANARTRLHVLRTTLPRVARRPSLLRKRSHAKILLCALGLWRPALRARSLLFR